MATKLWVGGNSAGANDASVAANWSPSGVPTSSDDVVFDGAVSVVNCTAGLNQSAYTYVSLTIYDSFTGYIGTASAPYQAGATTCTIHAPSGIASPQGSTRINLDLGSSQTDCAILGSASSGQDTGMPPIRIIGTHTSNDFFISGSARVGIAAGDDSEAAAFANLIVTANAAGQAPHVTLGTGISTSTSMEMSAGTVIDRGCGIGTVVMNGGTFTTYKAAAFSAGITVNGGTLNYNSSGTLASLTVGDGGTADFSRDGRAKTVSNVYLHAGSTLNLNNGNALSITLTNGIDLEDCGPQDVTIISWPNTTLSIASI